MLRISSHAPFCFLFFVMLCLPIRLPAKSPRASTAESTAASETFHVSNATWHDFSRLVDVEKGSHVSGVSELKRYFRRFGYLTAVGGSNFSDVFDSDLESAVSLYQKNLGLPVTGKLDAGTVALITSPRCGVSDSHMTINGIHATKRYAYFSGKPRWNRGSPVTLTYAFSKTNMIHYLSPDDVKAAFRRAFYRWAEVIPVTFEEVEDYGSADVKIGFYHKNHGDGQPFDGVLGILAHAFAPENGKFHLDAAETWAVDFKKTGSNAAVDLESVATHEIGHLLGLGHSSVKGAVMYPNLGPRTKKVELTVDDVEGVQQLYGSNPDFRFSSLLESDNFSNKSEGTRLYSLGNSKIPLLVVLVLFLCS